MKVLNIEISELNAGSLDIKEYVERTSLHDFLLNVI